MNGILIIDKPPDWTSHDVVAKLRRLLKERRIGHGGTLDPMATGVLPVFVGRATRAVEFAAEAGKEYVAGLRLGLVTDTQDITGTVLAQSPAQITRETLEAALTRFRGEILQLPPMYSAVKIDGKKLYELARKGQEVERKPRPVTIHALEMISQEGPEEFLLRAACSKGTYIRTLCHDLGETLGCGGCLSSLRRTQSAGFALDRAVTLDQVAQAAGEGRAEELLLPVDSCFASHPRLAVDRKTASRIRNGAAVPQEGADGTYRVYGPEGDFLMLGTLKARTLTTVKSFFEP